MVNFDLIFDNNGGITLQVDNYCHVYEGSFENPSFRRAAQDTHTLLKSTDDVVVVWDWDGNAPELRREYDPEIERNGGYHWVSGSEVLETVENLPQEDRECWLDNISGFSERNFFETLFEIRDTWRTLQLEKHHG